MNAKTSKAPPAAEPQDAVMLPAAEAAPLAEPQTEERGWPPFAAELLREVLARHQREVDEYLDRIGEACQVSARDGWAPDLEGARFVRMVPPAT